jgi:hypothetical protein
MRPKAMMNKIINFIINLFIYDYCIICGERVLHQDEKTHKRNPYIVFGIYDRSTYWITHKGCNDE